MTSTAVMGVLGKGDISKKTLVALIADRITGATPRFVFPVTEEHFAPAVRAVAEWALKRDYPYEVILDGTEEELPAITEVLEGAAVTHRVAAVEKKLISLLDVAGDTEDTDAALLIAWTDDDICQRTLDRALKHGVLPLDLTDGLNELKFDDDEEPAAIEEVGGEPVIEATVHEGEVVITPEAAQEIVKPKRTRRTKAQIEADNAAALAASQPAAEPADEAQSAPGWPLTVGTTTTSGNDRIWNSVEDRQMTPTEVLAMAIYDMVEEAVELGVARALSLHNN